MPLISVCIPVYNGAPYLEECIRSITDQGHNSVEIIVSDDHSTDGSFEIARELQAEITGIQWKLVQHTERLGMAGNWNHCLRLAEGEYVKVMGQDDILYSGSLAAQASVLENHPGVSLVVSGCDIMGARGKKLFKRPRNRKTGLYSGAEISRDCLHKRANLIGEPVTVMARRLDYERLGGFPIDQRYYIDIVMWLMLLEIGDCYVISDAQCAFRVHGKAVSSSSQKRDFDQFDGLHGASSYLLTLSLWQRWKRYIRAKAAVHIRSLIYRIYG
jgi:glycosyltransferase involved in cell wall biosynthesis